MRRVATGAVGLVALAVLAAALAPGASAAKNRKLVEGTVYDTTCVAVCMPECPPPPHCGPIPAQARSKAICAQRPRALIVCPLYGGTHMPPVCVRAEGCPRFPVYMLEGALVNVRRRGSPKVLARLPIVQGYFKIWLGPGQYVFHPYLAEEQCWSAAPVMAKVTRRLKSPVPVTLNATDRCVVHTDSTH